MERKGSAITELDLRAFLPIIMSSASGFASVLCAERGETARIAVHPSLAALKLRMPALRFELADRCEGAFQAFSASDMSKYRGIDIFNGYSVEKQAVLLKIGDEFLCAFARVAALGYKHCLPEAIAVPLDGTAADREASAYARSRLYAKLRTQSEAHIQQAANALFRCLCLFSAGNDELPAAHSSAVRSALEVCDKDLVGNVDSAAMAAALLEAEGPRKNKR